MCSDTFSKKPIISCAMQEEVSHTANMDRPAPLIIWQWRGVKTVGEHHQGQILATTRENAHRMLRAQGIWVSSLKKRRRFASRVKLSQWAARFEQLALQLGAGIDLTQAIDHQLHIHDKGSERLFWLGMKQTIQQGHPLSHFLATTGLERSCALGISLVSLAEKSGQLPTTLLHLSQWLDEQQIMRQRLTAPLHYPVLVSVFTLLVIIAMLIKVVPVFEALYANQLTALPLITQSLLWSSSVVINHSQECIVAAGLSIITLWSCRQWLLRHVYRIPIIGNLIMSGERVLILKTLGLSLTQGVTLDKGLMLIKSRHDYWQLENIVYQLRAGHSLGALLARHKGFGPALASIIINGEQTGQLAKSLNQASRLEKRKMDAQLATLERYLEPMLMVILSVILGGIVSALYLPIFDLGQQL